MTIFSRLGGTLQSLFRLNTVAIKDGGGVLLVRKADDSAYAKIQASSIKLSTGAADGAVLTSDASGNGSWQTPATISYPRHVAIFHRNAVVAVGNAIASTHDAAQDFAHYARQNAQINDEFFCEITLGTGIYALNVLGAKNAASGIVSWYLDNTLIGTQDWYAASITYNVTQTITSIYNVTNGYHKLRGVVASKNAAATGYQAVLTMYALTAVPPVP